VDDVGGCHHVVDTTAAAVGSGIQDSEEAVKACGPAVTEVEEFMVGEVVARVCNIAIAGSEWLWTGEGLCKEGETRQSKECAGGHNEGVYIYMIELFLSKRRACICIMPMGQSGCLYQYHEEWQCIRKRMKNKTV